MPKGALLDDPDLETITINDFTPGIHNGSHNGPIYSTEAPLGSASYSHRCYARPEIGLKPLPTYTTRTTKSFASGAGHGYLTLGDMVVQAGAGFNYVFFNWVKHGASLASPAQYDIDVMIDSTAAINNQYTSSTAAFTNNNIWPNMATMFLNEGGHLLLSAFTTDPTLPASTWVITPGAGVASHAVLAAQSWSKVAVVTSRMLLMGLPSSGVGGFGVFDSFITGDTQSDTNVTNTAFYSPDQISPVGAWGSVSTGEFVVIGQGGGAIIITGDIQLPSSAIVLPAVQGTGSAVQAAVPSPIGLVYVTDYDGVWVWNGGNTSQKISTAVVDTVFMRTLLPPATDAPQQPVLGTTNLGRWTNWLFFPNNYLFDCLTNAFWLCEDPTLTNFQVFSKQSGYTDQYFYASPANAYSTTGGSLSVPVMRFDHALPASSYRWISNPLPFPGSIISLRRVEICASNPTATSSTIKITATSPPNQSLFPNQSTPQSVTFTIPPNTASFRGSYPLGWADYNVCIQVDAVNSNSSNAAPSLHDITLGVTRRGDALGQ